MSDQPYLMESVDEGRRLEAKTDVRATRQQLQLVGLKEGMTALDAGAGTGAVARVMAEMVGPGGRVVALDRSQERLDEGRDHALSMGIKNIEFVRGELGQPGLPSDAFDLIWCRFVFQYLSNPDPVLVNLQDLSKPGGKIVVGDVDGMGVYCDGLDEEVERLRDKLLSFLRDSFDPFAGRKLYGRFFRLGLENIRVHLLPHHLYAGVPTEGDMANWEQKFETVRELGSRAMGGVEAYDAWTRRYLDYLRSPGTFNYTVLLLVEGTKRRGQHRVGV